jgi:RnfABCDGE-type electron transport complex B subunit
MRFISQYPNNMEVLLYTVLTLCVLGILAALILYFVAQKFKVEEDPRIDEVEKMLPGANCGGCGFAGCRGLADALVKRADISSLFCPVGGAEVMKTVAAKGDGHFRHAFGVLLFQRAAEGVQHPRAVAHHHHV